MQIRFASLRLLLDRVASKLLVRLAWCLQLHILNFTTLTLMADKPIYFLPMIAYQLRPVLKSDWLSETNRKNSKEFQEAIPWTVDKMKTLGLWIAITLIFHRHSSPLATMRLNRVISKTYENGKILPGPCFHLQAVAPNRHWRRTLIADVLFCLEILPCRLSRCWPSGQFVLLRVSRLDMAKEVCHRPVAWNGSFSKFSSVTLKAFCSCTW